MLQEKKLLKGQGRKDIVAGVRSRTNYEMLKSIRTKTITKEGPERDSGKEIEDVVVNKTNTVTEKTSGVTKVIKKPCGRPERKSPYIITEVPTFSEISTWKLSTDEVNTLKYRRMRDQNNVASKQCRAGRKKKVKELKRELEIEMEKNVTLKERLCYMEKEILQYRR